MSLHIRHGVWLGATPEKLETDKSKAPEKSRIQSLKDEAGDEDFKPDMPPPGAAEYLLVHFARVGPSIGDKAITFGEIRNYQQAVGIALTPWECLTLRRLSNDYLNESHRATKRDCPAPWQEADVKIDQLLKQRSMRDSIRALAAI